MHKPLKAGERAFAGVRDDLGKRGLPDPIDPWNPADFGRAVDLWLDAIATLQIRSDMDRDDFTDCLQAIGAYLPAFPPTAVATPSEADMTIEGPRHYAISGEKAEIVEEVRREAARSKEDISDKEARSRAIKAIKALRRGGKEPTEAGLKKYMQRLYKATPRPDYSASIFSVIDQFGPIPPKETYLVEESSIVKARVENARRRFLILEPELAHAIILLNHNAIMWKAYQNVASARFEGQPTL